MRHLVVGAAFFVTALAAGAPARADIPAGYTGTPYKGTPWPIPGRIEIENFDLGGYDVGFKTEHRTMSAPIGCSGGDYRTDADQPTMCKTNQGNEVDKLSDDTLYPSAANPVSYYIGAVRPNDWWQITVNVKTAGTYKLSTTWASDADKIDVTLFFNGVQKLKHNTNGTGGYHKWVAGPLFAEVQLDAGVQVLRFQTTREHVNADYVQFSLVTPGGLDDGSGDTGAGGAGTGGAANGGAAGSAGASAGSSGSGVGGDGAGGSLTAGASSGGASAAGASATGGASASAGAPSVGLPSNMTDSQDSGCSVVVRGSVPSLRGMMMAAVAAGLLLARRRRSATRVV